ncbi:MAG: PAS domain-containing protein [Pseudonocardia sp.]|jgi:DNA-binding CsgD family transcriptional regulator|nr:PAS domain-containing protein [Pseudonocardia sp.]
METTTMPATTTLEDDLKGELADVCVANLDSNLRLLEANDGFLHKLGKSSQEVCGQHFGDFVHPRVKQVILRHLTRLAQGTDVHVSTRFVGVRTETTRLSGELTGLAVRGDDGSVTTIVVLVRPDRGGVEPLWAWPHKRKPPLSVLDAMVLEGVAAGSSTVQLAAKLYLSRQGVEYHVGAMLRRFKCSNRSALVAKAYSQGILTMGQWPPKVTAEYVR